MVSGKSKKLCPADAYRKELRKKELKRNKNDRSKRRETQWATKDASAVKNKIDDLLDLEGKGMLDLPGKQRLKQLDDHHKAIVKAQKAHGERMETQNDIKKSRPEVKVTGLALITGRNPERIAKEQEAVQAALVPSGERPEDSPYYHSVHNPLGKAPKTVEPAPVPAPEPQQPAVTSVSVLGAPPGPPPGAPPGGPPGGPSGVSPGASPIEDEDEPMGEALSMLGAYDDDDEAQEAPQQMFVQQTQHKMNPARAALAAAGEKMRPQVSAALAVSAAPQLTGGNRQHKTTMIKKKSLSEIRIDPAALSLVPAALQRRRAVGPQQPAIKKRPAAASVAAPARTAPPPSDDYANFMSEIANL